MSVIKTLFSGIGYLIVGVLTVILIQLVVFCWPAIMALGAAILTGYIVVGVIKECVKK